jgi:membrane protein YqaA with SNARE-associated domain
LLQRLRVWTQKLYQQSKHWAQSDHCLRDLFLLSLVSCTLIPLPIEAVLLTLVLAAPWRWWRASLVAMFGSVCGAIFLYSLGYLFLKPTLQVLQLFSPSLHWTEIRDALFRDGWFYLAMVSFTPGLFRVGIVTAGGIGFNPLVVIAMVFLGRTVRFSIETAFLRFFGDQLRDVVERNLEFVSLVSGTIGLLLFVIIKIFK